MTKKTRTRKRVKKIRDEEKRPAEVSSAQAQGPSIGALVSPDLLQGRYSNIALVRHTPNEFVLDFLLVVEEQSVLVSRVLLSANHAKRLHTTLGMNLKRFEDSYGTIKGVEEASK